MLIRCYRFGPLKNFIRFISSLSLYKELEACNLEEVSWGQTSSSRASEVSPHLSVAQSDIRDFQLTATRLYLEPRCLNSLTCDQQMDAGIAEKMQLNQTSVPAWNHIMHHRYFWYKTVKLFCVLENFDVLVFFFLHSLFVWNIVKKILPIKHAVNFKLPVHCV